MAFSAFRLAAALAGLFPPVAPSPAEPASCRPPRLVTLQRYGWENAAGPAGLSPVQRRLGGGMLGQVLDLAEAADGALYVVDGASSKIVVFNHDGGVRRVLGGGKGEGPGEFARPVSIALTGTGEFFVLDPRLTRITLFDTLGAVRRTIVTGLTDLLAIRAVRDRLYAAGSLLHGSAPVVQVFDRAGTVVDRLFTPSAEDRVFGPTGNGYRMTQLRNGQLVLAHPNPGTWSPLDAPTTLFGRPLIADNQVRPLPGGRTYASPAALRGFGELDNGNLLILYETRNPESFRRADAMVLESRLAIVRPDGTLIDTLRLPGAGTALLVARDGKEFYLSYTDPFPQVVRYRLDS